MIKHKQVYAEKKRILNNFAVNPQGRYRTVTKVVRAILLNGPFLWYGQFYEIKAKSLGAGVYELRTEVQK